MCQFMGSYFWKCALFFYTNTHFRLWWCIADCSLFASFVFRHPRSSSPELLIWQRWPTSCFHLIRSNWRHRGEQDWNVSQANTITLPQGGNGSGNCIQASEKRNVLNILVWPWKCQFMRHQLPAIFVSSNSSKKSKLPFCEAGCAIKV